MDLTEIPANKDITYLGLTTFRDKNQLFGIKRKDRRQHVYVLGKSGTGKSVFLFNMIIQNIKNGEGICVVDPHGELVESVLTAIPPNRMKDVVYFNPADADYHMGFNVLELVDPQYKHLVASGLMGIFTKIWANAWSARMEYILNNCILALLDTPGTTLLGIPRMLVDKDYRQKIISNLKDPVIKAFWVHEYEAWQDKFRNEAIAPIQNKVGQFLSTAIIRNVVGQSKSTINIFDMMNDGKIFLVNVSKGRIGEDNSSLLGGMIITKIQLAAMERVRIPEENRKDFYLYVDEFQNFVTDAFASILSEARKYRLNLTVAHQYTAQLVVDKSSAVRDAVFGNVGTMIIFRVGSDDADFLEKEFEPEFTAQDIVNLPNYKIYLKLMIDGVTSRPFSAKTLPPLVKSGDKKVEEEVIKSSRDLYCRSRSIVEREINDWSGMSLGNENENHSNGNGNGSGLEKFPAVCSLCKKETTVPFKPEPGRAVYCKECVAKIKSGEVKVEKRGEDQIKQDESKFFKPLADLGIEYKPTNGNGNGQAAVPKPFSFPPKKPFSQAPIKPTVPFKKPIVTNSKPASIINTIKKVFNKPNPGPTSTPTKIQNLVPNKTTTIPIKAKVDNAALRNVLGKITTTPPPAPQAVPPAPVTPASNIPEPISLEILKNQKEMKDKLQENLQQRNQSEKNPLLAKNRAATVEDMNKLKSLISTTAAGHVERLEKIESKIEKTEIPKKDNKEEFVPQPNPVPVPTPTNNKVREVPEDVLKKILE